jgi:uncharacterized protein (TIGR02145 family)
MKKKLKIRNYLLLFTTFLLIASSCKKDGGDKITDIEGNVYTSVTIGTQVWMVENLKTTKYNDGTAIPMVTDNTEWSNAKAPAYCWYNNDISNKDTYGALYNWYVGNTGKLCPAGWHVPSYDEWSILEVFLGEDSGVGNKLKEEGTVHWNSPNAEATNETGFTGLPGGHRNPQANGEFNHIRIIGYFWSSSESDEYDFDGQFRALLSESRGLGAGSNVKGYGYSVRCLKD